MFTSPVNGVEEFIVLQTNDDEKETKYGDPLFYKSGEIDDRNS